MSENKKIPLKKLIFMLIAIAFVFGATTLDIFYLSKLNSIFGGYVVSRIASCVFIIIISYFIKFNIKNFCFRSYGWIFEVIIGAVYAVVPVALCFGVEYAVLRFVKGYPNLMINISIPNVDDSMDLKNKIIFAGLFLFTVLLQSIFKELFFRGYLITQLYQKFGLVTSNFIQAFLYMLLLVPTIVNYYLIGRFNGYGVQMAVFIIACNLFVDFISGVKWGLFYRVNGTVWMSVSDHFVNNVLLTCVYITYGMMPMKWYVVQAVAVVIISFMMFLPLYFRRDRQNQLIAEEIAVQRELAGLKVDNYSPSPLRHFVEKRTQLRAEEFAKKNNMPPPMNNRPTARELEEVVSLRDTQILSNNTKTSKSKSIDAENPEAVDTEKDYSAPSRFSQSYYDNLTQESLNTEVDLNSGMKEEDVQETDDVTENGTNISELVKNYFEDSFNKHTFNK